MVRERFEGRSMRRDRLLLVWSPSVPLLCSVPLPSATPPLPYCAIAAASRLCAIIHFQLLPQMSAAPSTPAVTDATASTAAELCEAAALFLPQPPQQLRFERAEGGVNNKVRQTDNFDVARRSSDGPIEDGGR